MDNINMQNLREHQANAQGFSIIEIMIVILIGGLIMAGAFGGYKWYKKAQITATQQKMGSLEIAINMYRDQLGQYPETLEELVSGPSKPSKRWTGALAKESDLSGNFGPFAYERSGQKFSLTSPSNDPNVTLYSPGSTDDE